MSREFGNHGAGFFHEKIRTCAEDCIDGKSELTRLWGNFLNEFYPVAYQISNVEAGDSGEYASILESIQRMENLKERLANIDDWLDSYRQVAENAVRMAAEKRGGK